MCTHASFFAPYFSCPFCRFSILVFLSFSFIFSTLKAYTVCARAQASIFMVFWPFSQKKLKKSERWPNKWSKVKTLEDKPRSAWPFFHKLWESMLICLIIPQNRKVKKFQLHIIDHSFEHNGTGISYQKKLESLEEEKAVHTSCKHGVRRICQLYSKGGPAGKLMWCEPPRDHLDYRRRNKIQRSSPKNTGRAKTMTTLRPEECDFGHALGARTFYTSPLRKC